MGKERCPVRGVDDGGDFGFCVRGGKEGEGEKGGGGIKERGYRD